MSPQQLAEAVGVGKRTIEYWEAGAHKPRGTQRERLERYLGERLPGTPATTAEELAALRQEIKRLGDLLEAASAARSAQVDQVVQGQAKVVAAVEVALRAIPSSPATLRTQREPR